MSSKCNPREASSLGAMPVVRWQLPAYYLTFAILLSTLSTGCSDGRSSVSGSVTLDRQPLGRTESRNVTIMFMPESGSGVPASALLDESGYYRLVTGAQAGLAPGKYIVTLAAVEASASGKRIVSPPRYANAKESDLRAGVKPGNNTFNFDLNSNGG